MCIASPLRLALLAWGVSLLSLNGARAAGVMLTQDGRPRATILLAETPSSSAQLAAYELQHYVKKMSGATLPMAREPAKVTGNRILVGESEATRTLGYSNGDFAHQEYAIKTVPGALLLLGHDSRHFGHLDYNSGDQASYQSIHDNIMYPPVRGRGYGRLGTCYAVHHFLENSLGVKWYYPNEEIGEVVPDIRTITVSGIDVRRRPDTDVRHVWPWRINTEQLWFADWDNPKNAGRGELMSPRASVLYWIRMRYFGAELHVATHAFDGWGDAFGETHPEWFSPKNYERMRKMSYQGEVNPCLSAPGFFEQMVQVARDYFDGKPAPFPRAYRGARGNFFSVAGMNDNSNMCGCDACRSQYEMGNNASNYVWDFACRVAREVHKTHPEAMISGIAYSNYTLPPKGLVFEPNMAVTFCKFYYTYHNRNHQERDYQRISSYINDNKAKFFTTWEYFCHPFMDEWPFPPMLPHVQADDVRRLSQIPGFKGGYLELTKWPPSQAWTSPVLDFMNMYWRMKLYDDFNFDVEKGLAEYYEKFFGPAGPGMEKFYTAMENRWMDLGGGQEARSWWGKMGTRKFLKEISEHIEEARQATEEGTLYRRRVELIDSGIMQYLLMARERYEGSAMAEFAPVGTAAVAKVDVPEGRDWNDDATWTDAPENVIEKTIANEPAPQKTVFRLAYDDNHLYIKAKMLEPSVMQMRASTQEEDIGGFSDDSVELFFDPEGKGKRFYQFCINSRGAVYDALVDPHAIGATDTVTWNSGARVKTAAGGAYWELRAAVPFGAFVTEPPGAGSTWRFNLCRNRYVEQDKAPFSAWSPTLGGFRNPERFGIITFNAAEEAGRILWQCDFSSSAFAAEAGESPLIGRDGWYENTSYANQGWDKSWKVVTKYGKSFAVCDVNTTNRSALVPMHAVQVHPGVVSVEIDYRRHGISGNFPKIMVVDAEGKHFGNMYVWPDRRPDIVSIDIPGNRQNFGNDQHGLGDVSAQGRWFGLRMDIDNLQKQVTGYIRVEGGQWVQLNRKPLPYYDPEADGTRIFIGFGTRRYGKADNNIVEMDNIRVTQLSYDAEKAQPR